MSVKVMTRVWDADLPRDEKYILLCLADFGNDEGESIYPSRGYIAWKTGYSETQVKAILRKMKDTGLVTLVKKHPKYDTNMYKINVDRLPQRQPYAPKNGRPEKVGSVSDPLPVGGGAVSDKPGAVSDKPGAKIDPDPLVKPLVNPPEELVGASGAFLETGNQRRTDATVKGDMMDGILNFAQKAPAVDVSAFPEDVQPVIRLYCELFNQQPAPKAKGSDYSLWVQDARLLMQAGGARTLEALKSLQDAPYDWMKTAMIGRPGALIKAVRARAGELRSSGATEQDNSPEALEAVRQRILAWKEKQAAAGAD